MIRKIAFALALMVPTFGFTAELDLRPIARGELIVSPADQLIRPQARRAGNVALVPVVAERLRPKLRPYERPELAKGAETLPLLRAEKGLFAFSPTAPAISLGPQARSAAFVQAMADRQAAIIQGQVCSDPAIQGDAIGTVEGRGQCGIDNAVRIRSVAGVQLKPAARMDCQTAGALKNWVTNGVQPATDDQAASLRVVSGYSCRFRNSQASGRLSEHSFGRAIDIAGIGLKDGREITVLTGWNSARDGASLRQMWRAACNVFGTVLGPDSNRFHRDHFHFDTARYRSGSYCR